MTDDKVLNRKLVVFGAIVIQLALGSLYAWSLFTKALKDAPYNFTTSQTQAIFSAAIVSFAILMLFAGVQMKKFGPRPLAVAGGLVLGVGILGIDRDGGLVGIIILLRKVVADQDVEVLC